MFSAKFVSSVQPFTVTASDDTPTDHPQSTIYKPFNAKCMHKCPGFEFILFYLFILLKLLLKSLLF